MDGQLNGKPGNISILIREAIGVAGISVPWNSPVALLIRSLAPALAAGCTVVVKMPSQTAQVNSLISEVISEVPTLPGGVINIVTGDREVLSYIVDSPHVPVISFTGSTTTGRALELVISHKHKLANRGHRISFFQLRHL
ncbi:MAG: aldehyde dehydrogenase [Mucilaginibacter sp.]|nr:aldehyde dehydrogenase [Mucilaginibacter sp.]